MDQVKIGWGRREVSLDEPMALRGQMFLRVSERVHDPMYATVLCVDGGEGQDAVIFCACDICTPHDALIEQMKSRVRSMDPTVPVERIILNATHTHTGAQLDDTPETTPDGMPIYPGLKYREFFAERCAEAVCEAWQSRKPGGIAYGYGYAVVAHQRRAVYFDDYSKRSPNAVAPNGHGVMYGNTDDEQFSHFENGADHFLNAVFTFEEAEHLTGVVINIPCPSQVGGQMTQQSSDYWHEVRQQISARFGEEVYVLPQCAAAGDLAPRVLHYREAQARRMSLKYGLEYSPRNMLEYNRIMGERMDIGERVAQAVEEVYGWAKKDIRKKIPVRHILVETPLARRMITEEEKQWCLESLEAMKDNMPDRESVTPEKYRKAYSRYENIRNRNLRAVARYEVQDKEPVITVPLHFVSLGELAFATNPFELFQDYMHRIQARSPFIQTFIVQLAGCGGGSYVPTERAVANKGYSASLFCNRVGPEGGTQLVETTLEYLNRLKQEIQE